MKYVPPLGGGANDPYVDANPATGVEGSIVQAAAIEHSMREIVAVIQDAGLVPDDGNLSQLLAAINKKIESRVGDYSLDTGAANAYVVAMNPAVTEYANGMEVKFRAKNANTGASTLNAGGGVVALKRRDGAALQAGDIPLDSVVYAVYDAPSGTFLLVDMVPSQIGGVVGSARNAKMLGGTFTADEVVVQSALGGSPIRLANVNKSIAVALNVTGPGGMDTGTGPVNSYVGIYLIYNPTTQDSALLAKYAGPAAVPEVYSGGNMPAGYTHSALVAVLPTGSGGGLSTTVMIGRTVFFGAITVLTNQSQTSYTIFSLTPAVPKNAKTWGGYVGISAPTSTSIVGVLNLAATVGGLSNRPFQIPGNAAQLGTSIPFENMPIVTEQVAYYSTTNYNNNTVAVNNYTF